MNSSTLIIETDYGEIRCNFNLPYTLAEIWNQLKACGYDVSAISTSHGVARTWKDGNFQEVRDLEESIKGHCPYACITSTLKDKPPVFCPAMMALIDLMNYQREIEGVCPLSTSKSK